MLADRVAVRARSEVVRSVDPVTLEEFGALLGRNRGDSIRSKAGTTIGPVRALGIPAWYSGVRYLAETAASLPWDAFRDVSGKRSERTKPSWLAKPDVEQPWFGFMEATMVALLHKGNAYSFKIRNGIDQVVGLREIHPDRVTTGVAPDGTKRFLVDQDETPYTVREILHIPGLAYNGRVGLNPIAVTADALGAVAATDDYAGRFFGQGTHVGGIISMPNAMTEKQALETKIQWDRFHEGLRNAHQTGVLSNGATYTKIGLNAADTQLIESRQWGVLEVARILRIPPHKLYELTHATFSNIEHQSIEAVVDSIRPWVVRIEAHFNFDLDLMPAGTFIEAQLAGLLRGDSAARAAYYTAGVQGGWLSPKRVAEIENEEAPDELGYYLRPLNMSVVRPGEPDPVNTDTAAEARRLSAAEAVQKVYLGVGTVLTSDEARQIVNEAGGTLDVPGPDLRPSPHPRAGGSTP